MMNDNLVVNINVFTATVPSLEQVVGIEPTLSAWKADVLTIVRYLHLILNYLTESLLRMTCRCFAG